LGRQALGAPQPSEIVLEVGQQHGDLDDKVVKAGTTDQASIIML
jgi:hypothetical protein